MNIEEYYSFAWIAFFILGTIFGSFLNLFAYRYPIMIFREHYKNIKDYGTLKQEHEQYILDNEKIGLCLPNSHCPHCKKEIPLYYNVPILGYFFSKGKCFNCKQKISFQYPFVEFITGVLFAFVGLSFGVTLISLALCISVFILLSIIIIDYKTYLLPNELTIPLLFIGLGLNIQYQLFTNSLDSFIGATVGYLIFSGLILVYEKIKNKGEMMGRGDFVLVAAFGAFFGLTSITVLLVISGLIGVLQAILSRIKNGSPIPYGPALSVTFILFIFFNSYLNIDSIINNISF